MFKTSRLQEILLLHSPLCSSVLPTNYIEHPSDSPYHSGEYLFSLRQVNLPSSFKLIKKLFSTEKFSFSFLWKLRPLCERIVLHKHIILEKWCIFCGIPLWYKKTHVKSFDRWPLFNLRSLQNNLQICAVFFSLMLVTESCALNTKCWITLLWIFCVQNH